MKFRSFEKVDRRILGIALLLLLLSTLLLWQDEWIYRVVQSRRLTIEQIGEVTTSENDVRRRFEVALSWLPLKKSNEVYPGDSIFTGKDSTAIIRTKSGEEIIIAPNSFVVINQRKDSISLNIGFGSIESRVKKGQKFLITSNNSLTELDGDNARVRVNASSGNKLLLNVLAGEVRFKSADGTQTLKQDEASEISPDGTYQDPHKPSITLLSPLADERFKPHNELPLIFKWKTPRRFTRMKIKISTDPEFKNNIIDSHVDDSTYAGYNLPVDVILYWEVIAEGGVSRVSKFAILGNRPPIPTTPIPGYHFFFDPVLAANKAGSTVALTWAPGSPATQFQLQVATDGQFLTNLKEFHSRVAKYTIGLMPKGEYFWRVRSSDFPDEKWSESSSFKVGPTPTRILSAPVSHLSDGLFQIKTVAHHETSEKIHSLRKLGAQRYIESFPDITWSPVAGADRYEIEISLNKNFTNNIVSETTSRKHYKWRNIEPGKYFYRVKALGEEFKDGRYNRVQELQLEVHPPLATSQSLIVDEVPDRILLDAPPPPLHLSWMPTIFSAGYEVEFSANSDFNDPIRFITQKADRNLQVDKPGTYFWRIRSLDHLNHPVSQYSQTNTIEFQRIYKDPALIKNLIGLNPKQEDSIILIGHNQSEIDFKWSRPLKDATYRIELSYEPDFKNVFFSTDTKENFYKFTEPLFARVIYWRVRAEQPDYISDWTGANRFLVTYETEPFAFAKSDLNYQSKLVAQERQDEILAAEQRKLARLRSPASTIDLQLDTPQLIQPPTDLTLDSNVDLSQANSRSLTKMPFEHFYAQVKNPPTIRWGKVPAAERYIFEISKDRKFTSIVTKAPCWNPFFVWDTVRPGQFYYRVQAFNTRYTRSHFSAVTPLQIQVGSPISTSPDNFVEVYNEPKEMWPPPSPFELAWTPVAFARGYEVEFSEDKAFRLTKVYRTADIHQEFRVSKNGLYYWRVRPISEYGAGIGEFSAIRSIEVIQTNRTPASANMLTGLFPLDRTMLFVGKGIMNLAFSWISPNPTDGYDVEVSTSAKFENVIATAHANKDHALVNDDLPEGRLYWRVKSSREVSQIYQFFLRREREPYSPETKASVQ